MELGLTRLNGPLQLKVAHSSATNGNEMKVSKNCYHTCASAMRAKRAASNIRRLLEIAQDDIVQHGRRNVSALAQAVSLLVASGTTIIRVGFPAPVGAGTGHAGAT
jgi:hypothetical protein